MCQGGFLQKNENEGWDLYEDLAKRTIQWESTSENSRNSNSISSKGGLHSIELSIANKVRIANLARRLEALETKEPSPVNQVIPNQFSTLSCTYCEAMIMCLRSVLCFTLKTLFRTDECGLFKAE